MPELPEVETVRRTLERVLVGKKIKFAEVVPDEIVLGGLDAVMIEQMLIDATVKAIGRKGKYWWITLDNGPALMGHLGMAGWIRELGAHTIRLREHGNAPMEDENGRPRFLKLLIEAEDGGRIAFTDGRRLARMWLAENPDSCPRVRALGPDCWTQPRTVGQTVSVLKGRTSPIKAALLDQKLFAGIGNWIADEVLYQAGIAPNRLTGSLSESEIKRLLAAIKTVLDLAVDCGADSERYPETWLFHKRWGGGKGDDKIGIHTIRRETIGGRTTAWVPNKQK